MDDFDLINFIAGIIPKPIKQIGKKLTEKPIKSIKFTNGSKLEYKDIGNGYGWYRDNKLVEDENYKFYDPKVKRYRRPEYRFSEVEEGVPITPIYMEQLNKLKEIADKEQEEIKDKGFANIIPSKERINLRTKGNMNLATVPINMLDSIAINSGRSGTNIKTNLGLVGKESTFYQGAELLGKPVRNFDNHNLINNHAYYNRPYSDYYKVLYNKLYNDFDTAFDDSLRIAIEDDIKHQLDNGGPKATTKIYNEDNAMADGFARYADNPSKYNPGQENYIQMVNNIANEVWSEPQIQKWWEEKGKYYYEKGKKERKTRRSLED